MLIIIDGTARVVRKGKRLATVGPGDFVGEMSLIDGYPRSASVVAETAVEALTLSSTAFKKLVADVPAFAWRLLQTQTQRIRAFDTRLETLR
jgi:CRP-like cAMP-binding protein